MRNRIREAIEVLARSGWAKNAFRDEAGRHCLQGALYEAHGLEAPGAEHAHRPVNAAFSTDIRLLNRVIEEQYPDRVGAVGVSRFNDHPDTTLDDVVTVLEKAALLRDERV